MNPNVPVVPIVMIFVGCVRYSKVSKSVCLIDYTGMIWQREQHGAQNNGFTPVITPEPH